MDKPLEAQDTAINSGAEALLNLNESLARKAEITSRLEDIASEKNSMFNRIHELNSSIRNLFDRLGGYPEKDKRNQDVRRDLSAQIQQARDSLAKATANDKALDEERFRLRAIELPQLTTALGAEGLLEHRNRITQAENEIEAVRNAIEAQHRIIQEAEEAKVHPVNRAIRRQDLMADITLGNATEADMKELDEEIAKEQKAIQEAQKKSEPLMKQAQAALNTLPGLERKLSYALEKLESIQSITNEVEQRFYLGEAENLAAEFIDHATQIKALYMRLAGVNNIITSLGGNDFMANNHAKIMLGGLLIPIFKLPQFKGMESNPVERPGVFFSSEFEIFADSISNAADAERIRIADVLAAGL